MRTAGEVSDLKVVDTVFDRPWETIVALAGLGRQMLADKRKPLLDKGIVLPASEVPWLWERGSCRRADSQSDRGWAELELYLSFTDGNELPYVSLHFLFQE